MASVSNFERIRDNLLGRPFDDNDVVDFLLNLGYQDITAGMADNMLRRFKFSQENSPRTLFLEVDDSNIISRFHLAMSHIDNPPSYVSLQGKPPQKQKKSSLPGCLIAIVIVVILAVWWISALFSNSSSEDPYEDPSYDQSDNNGSDTVKGAVDKLQKEIDQENKYGDEWSDNN